MNYLHSNPGTNGAQYYSPQTSSFPPNALNQFSTFPPETVPPGTYASEDISMMGYEDCNDQNDPKRRRIARACDMCRKKKIKCDGKSPSCSHCLNYKTECVFTQVEKKRAAPKGAKYIEGLENRLGRMEALLRLSGLLDDEDGDSTDLQTLEQRLVEKNAQAAKENDSSPKSSQADSPQTQSTVTSNSKSENNGKDSALSHPKSSPKPRKASAQFSSNTSATSKQTKKKKDTESEVQVEDLSEAMCSLVTNNYGDTRYIGSSSGFSIFSPKGISWINDKTGDTSFQDMLSSASLEDNNLKHWRQDVFGDIFQRKVYRPLPTKEETLSLLSDYFTHFNCMFPLFHETSFMTMVESHYSRSGHTDGVGWWASLNVALAIAHRVRVMSQVVPADEDNQAWGYLKNALAVQSELTMGNTDVLSIQALLGISMFLLGTPNPQPSFFLVAAAIRLSHSLGLHKKTTVFAGMNATEVEQRRRVFWIAYMLDKDICLRSGRPPVQDDEDFNVELPSEDPPDGVGNIPLADGKGKVNIFRLMSTFAVIASKVYKKLYSVEASKQSDGELLNTIGLLDDELEAWKDAIPIDFRPEHEIKASHTPLILHVVVLHFAYYNCSTTIHRMAVHHGYWTSRLSNYALQGLNVRPLNHRVFSSATICVQAARSSIQLIKYIPHGDYDCVWLTLYYPVSALVTLFANILQNPQDTLARSDLRLMINVVEFISMLCQDGNNNAVRRMLDICSEFTRISQVVLDNSDRDSSSRRKRKQTDKDKQNPTSPGVAHIPTSSDMHIQRTSRFENPQSPGFSPTNNNQQGSYFSQRTSTSPLPPTSPLSNHESIPPSGAFTFNVPSTGGFSTGNLPADNGMDPFSPQQMFQHPFVPQDLWQMPMALDWDWNDMMQNS